MPTVPGSEGLIKDETEAVKISKEVSIDPLQSAAVLMQ